MKIIILFVVCIFGLTALVLSVSFVLLYLNTHPERYTSSDSPSDFGLEFRDVYFQTEDNLTLRGWLLHNTSSSKTIIVCHGLGASKGVMLFHARFLYHAGFSVFLFDFRGHGESEGQVTSFGFLEQKDLSAAVNYIQGLEDTRTDSIGFLGESMGAAVGCLSAHSLPIKALCLDSCYSSLKESFRQYIRRLRFPEFPFYFLSRFVYELQFMTQLESISPLAAMDGLKDRAVLFISGEHDDKVPIQQVRALYEAAYEPKELWIIENARHVEGRHVQGAEYAEKVTAFFRDHL